MNEQATTTRPLYEIAREVYAVWPKVSYSALPYLNAMTDLVTMEDNYCADSADSIVICFLCNATGWRGADARRIKAELGAMLKAHEQ